MLAAAFVTLTDGGSSNCYAVNRASLSSYNKYPGCVSKINSKLWPLLHTTLQPLQVAATRGIITIMWSNTSPGTYTTGMVSLSHFIPLVPYKVVQPQLPTTATLQEGLKKHTCKQVTTATFLLPKKLSPRKMAKSNTTNFPIEGQC